MTLDCNRNQCLAVHNNARCQNVVVPGSSHCELHREKARKLYLKYKNLSDRVDQLSFDDVCDQISRKTNIKAKIKHLMDYYILLDNTYNGRMKHRMYAIVPEFYDAGHDYQFTRLSDMMTLCENKLSELHNQISPAVTDNLPVVPQGGSDKPRTDTKNKYKESSSGCREAKSYMSRAKSMRNEEINSWIEHYIADNQRLLHNKRRLMDFLVKNIVDMFDFYGGHGIDLFWQCVIISSLSNRLCQVRYFEDDFQPDICSDCNCGEYIPYDFRIGCSCMNACDSIYEFFNRSHTDSLERFFRILLFNKNKILPIIPDIIYLYKMYETNIFFMNLLLAWDPSKNRLKLEPDDSPPEIKTSKIYALNRLKKKFYDKEVSKMNDQFDW